MTVFKKIKELTDISGLTDRSKIYTPFTMFCLLFAIFYNLDAIFNIWYSEGKEEKLVSLKMITGVGVGIWIVYLGKVVISALGMTFVYALGQVAAAAIWGLGHNANVNVSALLSDKKYKLRVDYELLDTKHSAAIQARNHWKKEYEDATTRIAKVELKFKDDLQHKETRYSVLEGELADLRNEDSKVNEKLSFLYEYYLAKSKLTQFSNTDVAIYVDTNGLKTQANDLASKLKDLGPTQSRYPISLLGYTDSIAKVIALFTVFGEAGVDVSSGAQEFSIDVTKMSSNDITFKLNEIEVAISNMPVGLVRDGQVDTPPVYRAL